MAVRYLTRGGQQFVVPEWSCGADPWADFEAQNDAWDQTVAAMPPGTVFLDVGAWLGQVSLIAAAAGHPTCAIEPDPVSAQLLREAAHLNGLTIDVFQGSLCPLNYNSAVMNPGAQWGDGTAASVGDDSSRSIVVDALPLGRYLASRPTVTVGLARIELLGAEGDVLAGNEQAVRALACPLVLSVHGNIVVDKARYRWQLQQALQGRACYRDGVREDIGATVFDEPFSMYCEAPR